ncbi:peptide chain release factor 3 [Enterocloster lavalensis]|uniref:Peptide chain release factor 3 n=1 Tax=Enterocloster lavalensis TaxID=460384 RepID=A0A1I0CLW9_9FIRM|nr:GTP-binding protein [Enterocloster lavalensis]SET20463.1 peptide chain release factor 3 [Enterocloster lavalensis]
MSQTLDQMKEEINKRRTFAIISHPDAGKTTLTEKFLLYGGAINLAGTVKGRKAAKHAVSDWMDIEKERGISVTSSAMQFNYEGYCINILDTPGHQDFSEDTYRTLMAADSAVMVIDGSKGVEAQTIKLFKVCVMRHIPIFTFINKFDREARDPYELLDEIEDVLGIRTCPVNWPIGCGKNFKGVYDRFERKITTFTAAMGGAKEVESQEYDVDSTDLDALVGPVYYQQLQDDIELLDGASDELDMERVQRGNLSPGVLRLRADQLRCGDFPGAFPENDHGAPFQKDPGWGDRPLPPGFLRLCVQDPGQHEQGAPGPHRVHAHLLR